jgi:TPR repeat protein
MARDRLAAFNWLRKSAEGGHVESMLALWNLSGQMDRRGGFREMATGWLRRAAELGNREARRELRIMEARP